MQSVNVFAASKYNIPWPRLFEFVMLSVGKAKLLGTMMVLSPLKVIKQTEFD